MDLPLVEEIREARRLTQESADATLHANRAQSVLTSINLLEHQLRDKPDFNAPIPGDDLVDEIAERWPELSDLQSEGPRPGQPIQERLRMRRQQVRTALGLLNPLAGAYTDRSTEMTRLQHTQRHLLEDPKYADQMGELQVLSVERERVGNQLHPLNTRFGAIQPARNVISAFASRIQEATRARSSLPGLDAWRSATVASGLLSALDRVLGEANLEVPPPRPIEVGGAPDPADTDRLSAEVDRVKRELQELLAALAEEHTRLEAKVDALRQRYDELTRAITDRMG